MRTSIMKVCHIGLTLGALVQTVACGVPALRENGSDAGDGDVLVDGRPLTEHVVFVAPVGNGNLGGGDQADLACYLEARRAGRSRLYVALVADSTNSPGTSVKLTGKVYNTCREQVATPTTFFSSNHSAAMDCDADGNRLSGGRVFTGANANGATTTDTCADWTDANLEATAGQMTSLANWADAGGAASGSVNGPGTSATSQQSPGTNSVNACTKCGGGGSGNSSSSNTTTVGMSSGFPCSSPGYIYCISQ
jgi:hypothetical protein